MLIVIPMIATPKQVRDQGMPKGGSPDRMGCEIGVLPATAGPRWTTSPSDFQPSITGAAVRPDRHEGRIRP
jgi:hypothetical protein